MTGYDPIAPTHAFTHQHGGDDPLPMTIWDFYEIGDIHITTTMPDPIPQGWELIAQDRVLIGAGTTYDPEDTGGNGAFTHAPVGAHDHGKSFSHSGGGVADHPAHTHPTSLGTQDIEDSGTGDVVVIAVDVDPNSAQSHVVTQPNAHVLLDENDHTHEAHPLPPYFAVYFFRRVS